MKKILVATITAASAIACGAPSAGDASSGDPAAAEETPGTETPTEDPTGGETGEPAPTSTAALSTATLRNVGRHGTTLRIDVHGTDPQKRTSAAFIRVRDANDAPVAVFDTDWDGVPDSAERRFHFDTSTIGKAEFDGTITIPDAFEPAIANAVVSLEDETGGRSATTTATMTTQSVSGANDACDVSQLASRCPAAMSCGGSPATCLEGVAPQLTKFSYFGGTAPRILALASDPDEDVASMTIEFLDASGNPKSIELVDGDPSTAAGGITLQAPTSASGASFLFDVAPIAGFGLKVPKIAATSTDGQGRSSARTITAVTSATTRSFGQSCDYRGFDVCANGTVCAPGLPGATNACRAPAPLQAAKCTAGTLLDPAKGATRAFGVAEGVSLWDPPVGCAPEGSSARPEALVRLHLDKAAASVTITTALPETQFDSVVYVFKGCASSTSTALACNDDVKGFSSTVEMTDVAAGDYTIVVDSVHPSGGRFGIAVETK